MRVKICGITRLDQARAIAELGATDLGFICVPQSPRYIDAVPLATIIQTLSAAGIEVGTVGVFANRSIDEVSAIVSQTGLKTIQLHGQESLEYCQQLRLALPPIEIIKAVRMQSLQDLELAQSYAHLVDYLLLDAYHPSQGGGTGQTLDWHTLRHFRPSCPWLLAGGLTPRNLLVALSMLAPDGIDLSSGVEQGPGIKDLTLVKQLFDQLRQTSDHSL